MPLLITGTVLWAVMKPRHDIRSLVRQHRLAAGLTQQDLADRVAVTRQTILSIEKGKYTPSVALALSLAEIFGVSVESDLVSLPGVVSRKKQIIPALKV